MLRFINGDFQRVETKSLFDTSIYHAGNGGRLSAMTTDYIKGANEPLFSRADVLDLYGMSIDVNGGRLDCEHLISCGIYAGLALAEEKKSMKMAGDEAR